MYMCAHVCAGSQGGQKRVPWSWSCWWLWAATWVLGTKLRSSGRAACALNHGAISSALINTFWSLKCLQLFSAGSLITKSKLFHLKFYFVILRVKYGTHVEIRAHLHGSLLRFWWWNSGHQACAAISWPRWAILLALKSNYKNSRPSKLRIFLDHNTGFIGKRVRYDLLE